MKRPIHLRSLTESQRIEELRQAVNEILLHQQPLELTDGPIITYFIPESKNARVTLEGNRSIVLDSLEIGDSGNIVVVQDSVGGRTLNIPANSKLANVTASQLILSTLPNAVDLFTYYYDGEFIYWEHAIDENRILTLENNEYKITYFTEISNSTGTITVPTEATILLNQMQGGADAFVSTIQNGQPTGDFPRTSLGITVDVSSFDALGNYTLTGVPSSYPVALIYVLKIKAKYYENIDKDNELDLEDTVYIEDRIDKLQATRFISGTGVAINGGDNTKFDIQAVGEIVDPTTFARTPISVNLTAQTVTYIATQVESYVWINSSGSLVQSLSPPSPLDFDSIVGYWVLVHSNLTNLNVINSFPFYADGVAIKFAQLMSFIGFKKYPGTNIVSAGTVDLRLSHTGGLAIKLGLGNTTKRPVALLSGATDPSNMEMRHRNGVYTTGVQNVDIANYNPSGSTVSALLPNTFQAMKVWKFASGLIRVQYGQYEYATINEALLKLDVDTYVNEGNASRNGLHIGWIVVKSNLASWAAGTDGVDYRFVDVQDGKSSGGFTPTLQAVYDVSSPTAEITTNASQGAVTVKRGSAADTDNIYEGKNGAGTVTFSVNGNGTINSASETASRIASFDASKNIKSLNTATYPDLTELSYSKGVTSAIQTQLDSKATTGIVMHTATVQSPADNITYYIGAFTALGPLSAANGRKIYPPKPITITGCTINAVVTGTLGSNENVAVSIRVNNTTDYSVGNLTLDVSGQITLQNTAMTIPALATTDYYEVKFAHPTYATNPTNVYYTAIISYK